MSNKCIDRNGKDIKKRRIVYGIIYRTTCGDSEESGIDGDVFAVNIIMEKTLKKFSKY